MNVPPYLTHVKRVGVEGLPERFVLIAAVLEAPARAALYP
jgi:hypothetical protein